jgi:hypothetical protein
VGTPPRDPELTDTALDGEITLLGDLISLAGDSQAPLTDEQVDAVLLSRLEGRPRC